MEWFYTSEAGSTGPVSEAQLDELRSSGKINDNTLIWHMGMPQWQTYAAARSPNPAAASGKICAECGRTFSKDEMIQLNQAWICAACKPVYLQKMKEGVFPSGGSGLWKSGKKLVTRSETPFPDRCVKCNAPAHGFKMKRVLYWQPWPYYLLIFLNLLIMLIVIVIVRKKAVLEIGLCQTHQARRKANILVSWGIMALGFGIIAIAAFLLKSILVGVLGGCTVLGSAIYAAIMVPPISAAKITKENAWVKGVGPEFLAELPEWPGT
jgi:hypothetical protein